MKYLVLRKSGTVVSRHRTLATARRTLQAYLRRLARETDKVTLTRLKPGDFYWGRMKLPDDMEQVVSGDVFDARGRIRHHLYGAVVKLVDLPTPKRRSTKRRSTKKNRRRSSRGRR